MSDVKTLTYLKDTPPVGKSPVSGSPCEGGDASFSPFLKGNRGLPALIFGGLARTGPGNRDEAGGGILKGGYPTIKNSTKISHLTVETHSDQETIQLGLKLGSLLKGGDVVGLEGELGSGKTWLTKGIALGLGVRPTTVVTSPSFALVNEYEGRATLFHMDVYRLESLSEFRSAGLEEYFYSDGIVVMEWADRWPEILPEQTLTVELHILNDHQRHIILSGKHSRARELIGAIRKPQV